MSGTRPASAWDAEYRTASWSANSASRRSSPAVAPSTASGLGKLRRIVEQSLALLHRRLRSLATMELVNIPLQAGLWFGWVDLPVTVPNLVGFSVFALLLVEGAGYWAAKRHQLRGHARGLPGERAFRAALVVNPVLLAVGLAVTGYATATDPGRGTWPGLVFATFALLEHVNYFHVQLMHDTVADLRRLRSVGLRRSHLACDLGRARPASSG